MSRPADDRAIRPNDRDGNHPTVSGTYLAACIFYAANFRQSPEGLSFLDGLSSRDASVLQAEAAGAVLQNPDQWGLS